MELWRGGFGVGGEPDKVDGAVWLEFKLSLWVGFVELGLRFGWPGLGLADEIELVVGLCWFGSGFEELEWVGDSTRTGI